jgi:hypothetical protein
LSSSDDEQLVVVSRSQLQSLARPDTAYIRAVVKSVLAGTGLLTLAQLSDSAIRDLARFAQSPRQFTLSVLADGGDAIAEFITDPFGFVQVIVFDIIIDTVLGGALRIADVILVFALGPDRAIGRPIGLLDSPIAMVEVVALPAADVAVALLGGIRAINQSIADAASSFGLAAAPVLVTLQVLWLLAGAYVLLIVSRFTAGVLEEVTFLPIGEVQETLVEAIRGIGATIREVAT